LTDIESIQAEIRARLEEVQKLLPPLEAELEQLKRLAATFRAVPGAATPRRPPAGGLPRHHEAAPGGGQRAHEAVAKILEQPGITVSELAQKMGIRPNYLYRVLPRLEKEARVVKRGKGYHPARDSGPATTSNGQPGKG
jgi:transposase-like protein